MPHLVRIPFGNYTQSLVSYTFSCYAECLTIITIFSKSRYYQLFLKKTFMKSKKKIGKITILHSNTGL